MNPEALAGMRILIVEDDFFLAWDEQEALEAAGAQVIGPYGDEVGAISAASEGALDCAVLDLNLGNGPSFKIAAELRAGLVPFVLTTGYDDAAIPDEFRDVERLQKPINKRELVRVVCRLCCGRSST